MEAKFVSMANGARQVHPPLPSSPQPAGKPEGVVTPRPSSPVNESPVSEKAAESVSIVTVADRSLEEDEPNRVSLHKVVEDLNRNIQRTTRALVFTIDDRHGEPVVSVIDKETDKVIRQIPSEVALQVADTLEAVTGALLSEHA